MARHTADTSDKGKVSGPESVATAKEHDLCMRSRRADLQ
jgi:hypothetical protein